MKEQELLLSVLKGLETGNYEFSIEEDENGTITMTFSPCNSKKKEFEEWVDSIDDDIFTETWESLAEEYSLKELNDIYESDNFEEIVGLFKERAREIAIDKINELIDTFDIN